MCRLHNLIGTRSLGTALAFLVAFVAPGAYCLSVATRLGRAVCTTSKIPSIYAILLLLYAAFSNARVARWSIVLPAYALRIVGGVSGVKQHLSQNGFNQLLHPLRDRGTCSAAGAGAPSFKHDTAFIASPWRGASSVRSSSFFNAPCSYRRDKLLGSRGYAYRTGALFISNRNGSDMATDKFNRRRMVLRARRGHSEREDVVNYYKVLSLPEDCTDEDIRAKHEELKESLKSLPSIDRRIKQTIKEAYKVLSNPASRAMYDQKLKSAASLPITHEDSDEITDDESDSEHGIELFKDPDSDDELEITIQESPNQKRGGLSAFLGNLFGFNRDSGIAEKPDPRSGDISTTLNVELRDLVFGGTVTVNVDRFSNCPACNATKHAQREYLTACAKCRGRGMISKSQRTPFGYISTSRSCVSCNGRGISRVKDCAECSNTGRVQKQSAVELSIPAGTKAGSTFRMKHRGNSGGYFSRPGNLFIKVVSNESSREYIEGGRVYTCAGVDYVAAILGGTIDVETFCGVKQVVVPPGTQHGDEVLVGNYENMEHVVKLNVSLPTAPSQEEHSLLQQINELRK